MQYDSGKTGGEANVLFGIKVLPLVLYCWIYMKCMPDEKTEKIDYSS